MHELNKFFSSIQKSKRKLSTYRLQVGSRLSNFEFERAGKSVIINTIKYSDGKLIMLPSDVQDLDISRSHHLRSLNDGIPSFKNANDLKVCRIGDCKEMECVVSFSYSQPFQSLEKLYLPTQPKLKEVIKVESFGSPTMASSSTFSCLKVIYMICCSSMKTLLPHWLLPNLRNLEDIRVYECDRLIEILGAPASERDALIKFNLPKPREMKLTSLLKLKSICSKNGAMACDSLRFINVNYCCKLKRIPPFAPVVGSGKPFAYAPPSLEIRSSKQWWELLQWDDPNFKNVLQPHFINVSS